MITASSVWASDAEYQALSFETQQESVQWLAANGWDVEAKLVFGVEFDVCDCPLLRIHWVHASQASDDDSCYTWAPLGEFPYHVSEIALRQPFPSWWQPERAA